MKDKIIFKTRFYYSLLLLALIRVWVNFLCWTMKFLLRVADLLNNEIELRLNTFKDALSFVKRNL